jgi:hypothetical protein
LNAFNNKKYFHRFLSSCFFTFPFHRFLVTLQEERLIKQRISKTYRQRVEEFNSKLGEMTEHNDMPRVSLFSLVVDLGVLAHGRVSFSDLVLLINQQVLCFSNSSYLTQLIFPFCRRFHPTQQVAYLPPGPSLVVSTFWLNFFD